MCPIKRLVLLFRLVAPHPRPRACPPHAQWSFMSLSCSSAHKVLESPFSHSQLYGVDHPISSGSKVSTTVPSTGRRKSKVSKRKKSTHINATSPGGQLLGSISKPKSSKKKIGKATSASAILPTRRQSHKVSSPTAFSLARVDPESPGLTKKEHFKTSRVGYHTATRTTTTTTSWSKGHEGSNSMESKPKSTQAFTEPVKPAVGSNSIVKGSKSKSFTKPIKPEVESNNTESKSKSMEAFTKPVIHKVNEATATPTGTVSSLLSFSKMSTSDVVLSMSSSRRESALRTPVANTINLKTKCGPTLSLPPHMRVYRQAFRTNSHRQQGIGHWKEAWPLGVEEIARGLGRLQYQHIIVMSGAGISTPSGIPDFRSPGTGLYDNLHQYNIPDPTSIFDITYFSRYPKPFFTLAKDLYPGNYRSSTTHHFVKLLQEKKVLLRNYTQNIDGLERIAGVDPGKLVEAHGSFASASCIQCSTKHNAAAVKAAIFEGRTPRCKHKHCYGLVKPDIVFFGEDLPPRFYSLRLRDFAKCDLLIIMGTSLEVEPFASLVTLPSSTVPRLLLNRELVGPFKHYHKRRTDVAVTGDLVDSVWELVRGAGWEDELRSLQGIEDSADDGDVRDNLEVETHDDPPPPLYDSLNHPPSDDPISDQLAIGLSGLTLQEVGVGGPREPEARRTECARDVVSVREDVANEGGDGGKAVGLEAASEGGGDGTIVKLEIGSEAGGGSKCGDGGRAVRLKAGSEGGGDGMSVRLETASASGEDKSEADEKLKWRISSSLFSTEHNHEEK